MDTPTTTRDGVPITFRSGPSDPYAVTDGALRAKCYPGRAPAEVCVGDPADGCECYLPDGSEAECETAWQVLDGYYKVDVRKDGADSAR